MLTGGLKSKKMVYGPLFQNTFKIFFIFLIRKVPKVVHNSQKPEQDLFKFIIGINQIDLEKEVMYHFN